MTGLRSRRYACGALLLAAATVAHAMWAALDDTALLQGSDLIVLGEWQGQTAVAAPDLASGDIGVIGVSEVLKGKAQDVVLVALPAAAGPRSSSDPAFRRGERGLWLLRLRPGSQGVYLADHPQRFVPLRQAARIRALRQQLSARP